MAKKKYTPKIAEAPKVKSSKPSVSLHIEPFLWLAILTLLGTLIGMLEGGYAFFVSPFISIFSHSVIINIADPSLNGSIAPAYIGWIGTAIAAIIDLGIAGVFLIIHLFAKKRKKWAFIIGGGLYLFDTLLMILIMPSFLYLIGHAYILYEIFNYSKPFLSSKTQPAVKRNPKETEKPEREAESQANSPVKKL